MVTNKTSQPQDHNMTVTQIGSNWLATTGFVDAIGWSPESAISSLKKKMRELADQTAPHRHSNEESQR